MKAAADCLVKTYAGASPEPLNSATVTSAEAPVTKSSQDTPRVEGAQTESLKRKHTDDHDLQDTRSTPPGQPGPTSHDPSALTSHPS